MGTEIRGRLMEPRIQYAKTVDGVRIAYDVTGCGPPLVEVPGWVSHVELNWRIPMSRWFTDQYSRHFTFVRLDKRGTGASQRNIVDHSSEAHVRDLEAVVDELGFKQFALLGYSEGGHAAVRYAVRHPRRVTHLVLDRSFAQGSGLGKGREQLLAAVRAVVRAEWGTGSKVLSDFFCGEDADPIVTKAFAMYTRASASPEDAQTLMEEILASDITELLPRVKVPTLVLAAREDQVVPIELARELAAGIQGARFVAVDGAHATGSLEQATERAGVVISFVLGTEPPEEFASEGVATLSFGLRTVLFTDLVGHTEMMSRLGDERGRAVLREHERITREILKTHGGTEVKTMGDGFMASFGSVTKAVECAIALQRAMDDRNRGAGASHPRGEMAPGASDGISQGNVHPAPVDGSPLRTSEPGQTSPPAHPEPVEGRAGHEPLHVRVGLNAGEPIEEDGDLFGATVILAARIAAKAEGGEILVSDTVRGLCSGKGFLFSDRGEFVAKGFEEPVRVYEVRWREEAQP